MRVPRLPRRALLAATLGAVYSYTILPGPLLGFNPGALAWFALSAGLLFLKPLAYHAYSFWAILWVVYRLIDLGGEGLWLALVFDLPLPAASLYLLMTSGYREAAAGEPVDTGS